MNINISRAVVILGSGTDKVVLTTDLPLPAVTQEPLQLSFDAEYDTGVNYVKNTFDIEPEVINTRNWKIMSNKTIIYTYHDLVKYKIPEDMLGNTKEKLNVFHVNKKHVNKIKDNKIIPDPEVEKHENFSELSKSHYSIHGVHGIRVCVNVYSDGSVEIIPE